VRTLYDIMRNCTDKRSKVKVTGSLYRYLANGECTRIANGKRQELCEYVDVARYEDLEVKLSDVMRSKRMNVIMKLQARPRVVSSIWTHIAC